MIEIHIHPPADGDGAQALRAGRDEHRRLRSGTTLVDPVDIVIHAGTYHVESSIELGVADFGSVRSPVTWRSAGDGDVHLRGTRVLTAHPLRDPGIWAAAIDSTPVTGIYCDGHRMRPARYPSSSPDNRWFDDWLLADESPGGELANRRRFWCRNPGLATFDTIVGAEIVVFPRFNYSSDLRRIVSYDAETGEIRLDKAATYDIEPGHRFYIQRVPGALDTAGEWQFDPDSASVEFIPFDDMNPLVEVPIAEYIFDIFGSDRRAADVSPDDWPYWDQVLRQLDPPEGVPVSHLTIRDLTCEGTVNAAIQVESCAAVTIQGCTIRNCGQRGIRVIGGDSCRIADCEVSHIASGGIMIAGGVRRPFMAVSEPGNHIVTNCYIHHTGLEEKHGAAVAIAGVGNSCEHCLIHDVPRWAIHSRGNHHRIEYNHIRDLSAETSETAGIFLCDRDWQYRGTVIRFNYVHDVPGLEPPVGPDGYRPWGYGIYLDDWTSGVLIEGNIVANIIHSAILVNSGHSNVVVNNIVHDSFDDLLRVQRWPSVFELERMGTDNQGFRRNSFQRNIFVGQRDHRPAYTLDGLLPEDEIESNHGNTWDSNLIFKHNADIQVSVLNSGQTERIAWDSWTSQSGQDNQSVVADPLIGENWQLASCSPALALGFEQIPFDRIGILHSENRLDWPPQVSAGMRESRLVHPD